MTSELGYYFCRHRQAAAALPLSRDHRSFRDFRNRCTNWRAHSRSPPPSDGVQHTRSRSVPSYSPSFRHLQHGFFGDESSQILISFLLQFFVISLHIYNQNLGDFVSKGKFKKLKILGICLHKLYGIPKRFCLFDFCLLLFIYIFFESPKFQFFNVAKVFVFKTRKIVITFRSLFSKTNV